MRLALPLLLILPSTIFAQAPSFTAVLTKGEPQSGRLERIDADESVTLNGVTIPLVQLVELGRDDVAVPPMPTEPHFVLSTGDRIVGELIDADENGLRFRPRWGIDPPSVPIRIPMSYAGVLWLVRSDSLLARDARWRDILGGDRKRDMLLLRNRDVLSGLLTKLDPAKKLGTIDTTEFDASRLAAIAFNTSLARTRKPTKPYAVVTLANGTRLTLVRWTSDDQTLTGESLFGTAITIRLRDLVHLRILNGKVVYLSDLKPTKYNEKPYLGATWGWSADSAWGQPLTLNLPKIGPSVFDKGIAMHSTSTITYSLGGRYSQFQSKVGVQHGCTGTVEIVVMLDGKRVELHEIAPNSIHSLNIDVTGAKEMVLNVNFGRGGSVQDQVDWVDTRLFRKD